MRKFGKESTAPDEGVGRGSGKGWLQNHGALAVCIVAILAFVLRVVFAYGVSADNNFALSGGSEAQYHLHVVESILSGSFVFGNDIAMNYPVGGLNVNPPLYDFIAAGVGSVASASTALAILAPIFGALTVFPVYLIGKELKDTKVGVLAALIYALMALPICSTVLSNGTEYAFTAFLIAFFGWALVKMAKRVNEDVFSKKEVIIAGLLLAAIALSWNGFRVLLVLLIVIMVIQMLVDRFNSKDFSVTLYSYSLVMLIGVAIAAIYYIPANLWDAVFSGPVLITVIAVAFGFIFKALQVKPWIFVVPALIIAFAVIAAVLYFVAPDYFTALIFGNSAFINPIMDQLASVGVSISKMSSYYGWVLMWMPIALGIFELYRYARKERTHFQLFTCMWLIVLWIFAWSSYGAAAVLGSVFAVSSSIVILAVLERADLKTWAASMKAAGFSGFFRKMIKPLPFISVLVGVFLIIVPGLVYAVDAGISSNNTFNYFAYGNTVYTIEEGDKYPITNIYRDLSETGDKSQAVVSWIDYASDLEALGYNTVNDRFGTGASAAAQIYLAEGSAGATAAQIIRIMSANPNVDFSKCFEGYAGIYGSLNSFIKDPSTAKTLVLGDPGLYGSIRTDLTNENAMYLAGVELMTSAMSTGAIMNVYQSVTSLSGQSIGYYIVDGSMVPLLYGDGSITSTLAYFAGHTTDTYGAATDYFSYLTIYSNYYPAYGKDALYQTFLWKALIGPSPSEAGFGSSFAYLYELSASNGKVKAMPGYGLAGYSISSWYVKYNPSSKATSGADGWEYMTYDDAIKAQQKNGGLINYLSSLIMLEYEGVDAGTHSGVIVNENDQPLEGITVQVLTFDSRYEANVVYSETKTNAKGEFSAMCPPGTDYMVVYKNGSVKLESSTSGDKVTIHSATFEGLVVLGTTIDLTTPYLYVLEKDGYKYFIEVQEGRIKSSTAYDSQGNGVLVTPGSYNYELRDSSGTAVASGTVSLYAGDNVGLAVSPKAYTITASIVDFFGNDVPGGTFVATNTTTLEQYTETIDGGSAVVYVPSGTYTVDVAEGYKSLNTTTLNVTSNRTVSITAYDVEYVKSTAVGDIMLSIYGGAFSAVDSMPLSVEVPTSIGATQWQYSIYGTDGKTVYYGKFTTEGMADIKSAAACKVTGSISGSGTVSFITSDNITISAAAGSDGKFTVYLPAGKFTLHAYNSNDKVYLSTVDISGDKDLGSLTLGDGKTMTVTYNYASGTNKGNVSLPFTAEKLEFTYNGSTWTLPQMSNSTGKATYVIPQSATSITATINGGSIDNGVFKYDSLTATFTDGSTDASKTVTIPASSLVKVSVTSDYAMTLSPYGGGDKIEFAPGETKEIAPGQFAAKIEGSTGKYFSGTIYLYPGCNSFSNLVPTDVYTVKITKGQLDEVTIKGDSSYYEADEEGVYYFEYDCEYFIESGNGSTGAVAFGYVYQTTHISTTVEVDVTATARLMTVTGYVGVVGDGTLSLYYGNTKVTAEIEGGGFSVKIPSNVTSASFVANVTKTVNSNTYGFSGSVNATDLKDGSVVNIAVLSDDSVVEYTNTLDAKIESATFNNGKGVVKLTIYNNTDLPKTYSVVAGSAWVLDKSVQIIVDSQSSAPVTVTGTYEAGGTGIGSEGMTVIVSDFNGTTSKTLYIEDGTNTPGKGEVTVKVSADSYNKDRISGSEYQYALTFYNNGSTNQVKINATVSDGYTVVLMNEDGSIIKQNNSTFIVTAQSSTVVYVKVMDVDGTLTTPSKATITATDGNGKTIVSGLQLSPSEMDIEVTSMTVSGDKAVDQKSGVPLGVWFIFGVSILLLILIVWMGSKRGVFTRR
jgi:asparagine N-glycosylation enzyme membrane subunit Stt3